MLPFPSYYGFGNCSSRDGFPSSMEMMEGGGSRSSMAEAKVIAACKSHSEAERRRRQRINGHLATLRTLLPNTTKTDKASLLAEVVQHVKELKKLAAGVASHDGDGCNSNSNRSREWAFPGETDELTLGYCDAESKMIKASLCCDDRPDLLSDLTKALRSARGRITKAEMATVGGRTKSVLVIQRRNEGCSTGGDEDLEMLRRALKAVLDKPILPASGRMLPGNKRPRLFSPAHRH